jgi:hypothetical protein
VTALKWLKLPALLACLSAFLTMYGCSYPVVVKPSELLTQDCDSPTLKAPTYRGAIILAIEQDRSLQECTDRMRAIRK